MDRSPEAHIETEMAALAAGFVNSTDRHVFLTGKAGTGKTTLLRRVVAGTHKRCVIVAPTGIAALNAGGVTIHSQFLLPFGTFVPERRLPAELVGSGRFHDRYTLDGRHPLNAVRRQVLRDLDLLVIDEVSMLRADVLDAIDHRMRVVRGRAGVPFGGVQLLLIGDLFQLPPVVKDEELQVLQRWYRSLHFFESLGLREAGYAHIELDRIFRQRDEVFVRVLNNLREDRVTADDIAVLNTRHRTQLSEEEREGLITLTTHNRTADELNSAAMRRLPGRVHRFSATVEDDFPEHMYPVLRELELKEGAQVMFTRNDPEKAYFNGKLAKVWAIDEEGVEVRMLDDDRPYRLKRERWENKRYVVDPATQEQREEVIGSFEQYPVKLAWAITVHKSQGLTFDKAIVDVGQAFAPGQVYVALSRLRSLEGLILRTPIAPRVVSTDPQVVAFSEQRHSQRPLPEQLREHQRSYLHGLFREAFAFGGLQETVAQVMEKHPVATAFEDEVMREALPGIRSVLQQACGHADTFRTQLARLLDAGESEALLKRLVEGEVHFAGVLDDALTTLLRHLGQVEQLSRTKEYAADLRELDAQLARGRVLLARSRHVAAHVLDGTPVERDAALEQQLMAHRETLVRAATEWAREHPPQASTRSGRRRTAKVGGEKPRRGATYAITWELLRAGRSIAEVALERGLTEGTIQGHVARGIAAGELPIDDFVPEADRDRIAAHLANLDEVKLADVRLHFGEAYGFGTLRIVQAWMERQASGHS